MTYIELLGKKAEDRVTGLVGVVSSVSFDLFGCVQAFVRPWVNSNGELPDGYWFDVARLRVSNEEGAMPVPDFAEYGPVHGPECKPSP